MEQMNLDTVKSEITSYLQSNGFIVFHGYSRALQERAEIEWDVARYPDYRDFLKVARELDVRLIVFHHREFSSTVIDRALEELEGASYEYEDQRDIERRLRELRVYDGFTCAVELSFDHGSLSYVYELRTEWYTELNNVLDELDVFGDDDDDDEEDPLSGYYSKN
jgi:hypothetical protein